MRPTTNEATSLSSRIEAPSPATKARAATSADLSIAPFIPNSNIPKP